MHPGPSLACVALALAACTPSVQIGTLCEYNSDCPSGLACVNGRCGEECRAHRDCPLASECLLIEGMGRCRLPEDTCAQCGEGLVCGEDDLCHSPCGPRCPSDGECILGACVRRTTDAGAPRDALVDDAGFGAPTYEPHIPCTTSEMCPPGQECASAPSATAAVCRIPCTEDGDCGNGLRCARFATGSEATFCSIGCNPVTADGCPATEACDLLESQGPDLPDGGGMYVRYLDCRRQTTAGVAGEPCLASSPDHCAAGHSCFEPTCRAYCPATTGGRPNPYCAAGEICSTLAETPAVSGVPIGYCRAP